VAVTTDRPVEPSADTPAGTAAEQVTDATAVQAADLTDRQRAILDFEATWWMHDDDREAMIRARFQVAAEEYYRELNLLLDHPAALSSDPLVVRRLRRHRDRRRRARIDGTATGEQGGANA
jgi:hypothetical protein